MTNCAFSPAAIDDAASIAAGLSPASAERFYRLLEVAAQALRDGDIRTPVPDLPPYTFLPLHRLQTRLPPPRGPKSNRMLVLERAPPDGWLVLAIVHDSMLPRSAVGLAEGRS